MVAEVESPHADVVPSKQESDVVPVSPVPPAILVETSFDDDDYPTEVHCAHKSCCISHVHVVFGI